MFVVWEGWKGEIKGNLFQVSLLWYLAAWMPGLEPGTCLFLIRRGGWIRPGPAGGAYLGEACGPVCVKGRGEGEDQLLFL